MSLAFLQAANGQFVVLTREQDAAGPLAGGGVQSTTLDHEDFFLERLIHLGLRDDDTARLTSTVLLSTSAKAQDRWVNVDLTRDQLLALGLDRQAVTEEPRPTQQEQSAESVTGEPIFELLMQAPVPFAMLSGPEHRFVFINPPYIDLMGRSPTDRILGATVREVLPELAGQPFFSLLDRVYRTGEPVARAEMPAKLRSTTSTQTEERFFDFVYHPVRDGHGEVTGILVQAADVTDRVLAREVSENREQQLFRQGSEIDLLYRTSPAGMTMIDAGTLRVLRINEIGAAWFGTTVERCLGKSLQGGAIVLGERLQALLRRAVAGETLRDQAVERTPENTASAHRLWKANLSPSKGVTGQVNAVLLMTVESFL